MRLEPGKGGQSNLSKLVSFNSVEVVVPDEIIQEPLMEKLIGDIDNFLKLVGIVRASVYTNKNGVAKRTAQLHEPACQFCTVQSVNELGGELLHKLYTPVIVPANPL